MQKRQKSSYKNYTQPVNSASHHQRRAKLANQQASDAARDQLKKVGSPPNQIHIIQKKDREGERTEERQKYRGMQEEPVHIKRHRNTHTWRTESEQSIQNVQISNVQTETTRCRMHIQKTPDRWSILNLTVHEQQWRNDEWNKDDYRERKKAKDRQDGGCKYHSSKIKTNKKSQKQTMVVKHCRAFQISVAHQKDLRHTPTHTIKNQTDRKENKNLNKGKLPVLYLWSELVFYTSLVYWSLKLCHGSFFFLKKISLKEAS